MHVLSLLLFLLYPIVMPCFLWFLCKLRMNNNIVGMETNMEQLLEKVFGILSSLYPSDGGSYYKSK